MERGLKYHLKRHYHAKVIDNSIQFIHLVNSSVRAHRFRKFCTLRFSSALHAQIVLKRQPKQAYFICSGGEEIMLIFILCVFCCCFLVELKQAVKHYLFINCIHFRYVFLHMNHETFLIRFFNLRFLFQKFSLSFLPFNNDTETQNLQPKQFSQLPMQPQTPTHPITLPLPHFTLPLGGGSPPQPH